MSLPSRRFALAAIATAVLASRAFATPVRAQAPIKIRFTLDWRFEAPAALFTLALDRGYFADEGLDVSIDPGNGARDVIPKIAANTYDLGLGDVNALIRFRDDNPTLDVKAVMLLDDRPAFSIVGRKSRGITRDIKSLEGKKFGAPATDAAYAQWPILKAMQRLDASAMTFENVGFPVREPMLASGEVDAVFGLAYSSFITLKARGVAVDDITLLLMSDYGLDLYGNAVVASPKLLAENPGAVRKFLTATLRGIKDVIKDREAAIDSVIKRNDAAKKDVELERLSMVLEQNIMTPWVKANGIGAIDSARWARALDQIGLGLPLKDKAKAGASFTDAFLPPAAERKLD